jgi:glycine/D-amino acid oxidase-like deaminating enzyme/nitrite reductase/ring-hydroxylating ferredoxin subunit
MKTAPAIDTTPIWLVSEPATRFPALRRDLAVDAVVVGAGMTGVTTAYLLKQAGLTVALVEKGRLTQGETSHTTAHLAAVSDRRFTDLSRSLGTDHAQAVWDAGFAAIAEIDAIIRRERIGCQFRWTPGFLHASLDGASAQERDELRAEADLLQRAGFDATYLESVPGVSRPGIRFEDQAKFHPVEYLTSLVTRIPGDGSHVFEESVAEDVESDPLVVIANGHRISARFLIVATHIPIVGKASLVRATLLQTDLYGYSTYAVAARAPRGRLPEALWWDTSDPYYYMRVDRLPSHDLVIFGGGDHKTGQSDDTREPFARVEAKLRECVPDAEVTHRWSGQVIETRDGLPYIGETSPAQFVATGFSGNGITFATLSALMARDWATGRANPWRRLFDANRTQLVRGLWNYLSENKDYPYYLVRDRFAGAEGRSVRALARGQGRILDLGGRKVAAYRGEDGAATLLSPYCTHLGCVVDWNEAESTWDCPCHGSRFSPAGEVIAGPAETPLARAR